MGTRANVTASFNWHLNMLLRYAEMVTDTRALQAHDGSSEYYRAVQELARSASVHAAGLESTARYLATDTDESTHRP